MGKKKVDSRSQEEKYIDKINYQKFKEALLERSGGRCEICGKADTLDPHHIGGRKPPQRKNGWPEELCEDWPHCPELNGIVLCRAGHSWAGDATKHSKPLLWAWLDHLYGGNIYKGKTISEWLAGEGPWRGLF